MNKIEALLKDHQAGHTAYQMDNFITIANGITLYGMYKQALREVDSRYTTLKETVIGLSAEAVDRKIKYLDANTLIDFRHAEGVKKCDAVVRELAHFVNQAQQLKMMLPELTEDTKLELEREYWRTKFAREMALKFVELNKIDAGSQNAVASLSRGDADLTYQLFNKHREAGTLADLIRPQGPDWGMGPNYLRGIAAEIREAICKDFPLIAEAYVRTPNLLQG